VALREGGRTRRTSLDGTVIFAALAVLTLTGLAVIGASFGSLAIVGFGFLGLIAFAARAYLADLGAGAVLRLAQPFKTGDVIHLYSTDEHEFIEATVIKLGALRTTLAAPTGVMVVPNHQMISDESEHDEPEAAA
jgi:small-conductance mechanosensitive channel